MRKWIAFILAAIILAFIHESTHALTAMLFDEYQAFRIHPIGFEVVLQTPVPERQGAYWALISGLSNILTIILGYMLFFFSSKIKELENVFIKCVLFYLTILALVADPLNLSIGPFFYGGDATGIAVGLGINRLLIQVLFLFILLINRELIAQKLFPQFGIEQTHFLFKPIISRNQD